MSPILIFTKYSVSAIILVLQAVLHEFCGSVCSWKRVNLQMFPMLFEYKVPIRMI